MVNWPSSSPVRGRASCAARWALRLGSWHRPVTVDQKIRAFADRVQVQLFGLDLQVRSRGEAAVEVEREFVRGGLDGAEGHSGGPVLNRGDEGVIDVELVQFAVQVGAERVIAGAGDNTGPAAMPGGGNGNVRGGTTEVLAEGRDVLQVHPDVVRVDINADAPDRKKFMGHGDRGPFWCGTRYLRKAGAPVPGGP